MKKGYSRLATVEEKRNIRGAYLYIILSIVAVIILFFLGLPTLVKFAGFLGEVGRSGSPVDNNDITPPAPPQLERSMEHTNKRDFKFMGNSEDGAIVTLIFNEQEQEAVANNEGRFAFDVQLEDGENTFTAKAKDRAGNESQQTEIYKIFFDDQAPDLSVDSPKDGASYYGSGQRQLVIKGLTSDDSEVYINGRYVSVDEEGNYSLSTTLSEGENKFEIVSKDLAGNETKSSLVVNFSL